MIILKEIKKHPLNYLILTIVFIVSIILFFIFRQRFDAHDQRRVVYVTAALYLFWSLYHHYKRGDLHFSIIIEYLLLALFAILVAITTLI
jgi:uncharacterized membrane protein